MELFDLVAMGGTFDAIHSGHMALLNKAFSISSKVIIGLTSDQLATKKGKNLVNDYSKRLSLLKSFAFCIAVKRVHFIINSHKQKIRCTISSF